MGVDKAKAAAGADAEAEDGHPYDDGSWSTRALVGVGVDLASNWLVACAVVDSYWFLA